MGRKPSRIRKPTVLAALLLSTLLAAGIAFSQSPPGSPAGDNGALPEVSAAGVTGSDGCRECHERFYQLWSTSFHGLAMQAFTPKLAKEKLTEPAGDLAAGALRYRADIGGETAWVVEQGPKGERKYRIDYAMGGKNVFYFLTPLEKGRLQVLPVAYDVRKKEWFLTTASHLRPFSDNAAPSPLDGPALHLQYLVPRLPREPGLRSTTTCRRTATAPPGRSRGSTARRATTPGASTCGWPGRPRRGNRSRTRRSSSPGSSPWSSTTPTAARATRRCPPSPRPSRRGSGSSTISTSPTLEDPDFSPDGRDLGENYTYTRWRMSPCVKSGKLSCMHCHTSSGRYRFRKPEDANKACLPCHEERVGNAAAHSRHPAESEASRCVSCHMPMTEFARMRRSDHSMLPPTPAATIAYKSPNACNLCHADKNAAWADNLVRAWRPRDYQAPVLRHGGARRRGPEAGVETAAGDARLPRGEGS